MFTGIIEEVGTLMKVQKGARSAILTIGADTVLEGTKLGDSIAVNGICLTVTGMGKGWYTADVMSETLNRSCLGGLKPGSRVNLERAMSAEGRFGGHMVSGHIDGTGVIKKITEDDNAVWYQIQAGSKLLRYIVEKGSIAINGISLTVARVTDTDFSVSVIPHTRAMTNLVDHGVGDPVNLECDIIGKYVEKLLKPAEPEVKESRITEDFLRKYGF